MQEHHLLTAPIQCLDTQLPSDKNTVGKAPAITAIERYNPQDAPLAIVATGLAASPFGGIARGLSSLYSPDLLSNIVKGTFEGGLVGAAVMGAMSVIVIRTKWEAEDAR